MAGTVIDELILKLNLDGTDFRKGADEAVSANKKIRDSATTTASTLESKGKVAASFWTTQKIEILGILGVLAAGGKALEDITRKAVTTSAAMGRAADIGNTTPQRLSGLRAVAREYGSTAEEATSAIGSILKAERDLMTTGQVSAPLGALRRFNIQAFDAKGQPVDPVVQIEQIAAALKKLPEQQAIAMGQQLGFADTFTNALRALPANDPAAIEKLIQSQATTTAKQAVQAEKFVTASEQLNAAAEKFENTVTEKLGPYIIPLIKDLTQALDWLSGHPDAATAVAGAGTVLAGAAGKKFLTGAAKWLLGRGGSAADVAALEAGEATVAAGGTFILPAGLAAALVGYQASQFSEPGHAGDPSTWPVDSPFWNGMSPQEQANYANSPRSQAFLNPSGGSLWSRWMHGGHPTADVTMDPTKRAFLDTLAGPESGGRYNVKNGGSTFDSYAEFPEGVGPGGTSSAAGRYQLISGTWRSLQTKLGLKDFSPTNQDKAAWDLAATAYHAKTGRSLEADLKAGGHQQQIAAALGPIWPSLPGGSQSHQTQGQFDAALARNMAAQSPPTDVASGGSLDPNTGGPRLPSLPPGFSADPTAVLNGMRAANNNTTNHNTTINAPITIDGAKSPQATGAAVKAALNTLGVQSARGLA